jgi:dihydroflavonol-4-reductase
MQGCDGVIHLACLSSWTETDFLKVKQVAIDGTRNVLDAAKSLGGPRVVFISSAATINGSLTPQVFDESSDWTLGETGFEYADAKRAAEALCLEAARDGLPVVVVNPTEVYGPQDTSLVTAGNLVDFTKGKWVFVCRGGTSVVHVEDVARGIVRALERGIPGQRYILGGENLTIRDLAATTLDLMGLRRRIVSVPNGLARAVGRLGLALRLPLPFNPHVIPYATRYWFVDASKAQRELGVSFRPARETLASVVEWLCEAGYCRAIVTRTASPGPAPVGPVNRSRAVSARAGSLN